MSHVYVIGIGPGDLQLLTGQAREALTRVTQLYGYKPYLDRLAAFTTMPRYESGNGDEVDRARHALRAAEEGESVGLVSGGDAGVFGMASALFEAIETGPASWRAIEVTVIPGVTAVLAAAARLGAPLGGDFAILSLSDNLKPWSVITRRLRAAAEGGFVIALYNARSRARPQQLVQAFEVLRQVLPPQTSVAYVHAVTRPDERVELSNLGSCTAEHVDMRSLVIIGAEMTRSVPRPDGSVWLYTPRYVRSS